MAKHDITGIRVAILATDGFEESELFTPLEALEDAGAQVYIVSSHAGTIQANRHREHGDEVDVDYTLDEARAQDFNALFIPGGLFSPDELRTNPEALAFVRSFMDDHKVIGAICHGPQVLISAGLVERRKLTGYEAIQADLANAGARVLDQPLVVDGNLVTSRNPDDLDAFCDGLIQTIGELAMRQGNWGPSHRAST